MPVLGRRLASEVRSSDLAKLVNDVIAGRTKVDIKTKARGRAVVKGGVGAATRALAATSAMFTWALREGLVAEVPKSGVKMPQRPMRASFLTALQARHLLRCIDALQLARRIPTTHASIFKMLLLTGARRTEISGLRWSEVDLEAGRLSLPPERTKAGGRNGQRRIHLSPPAVAILVSQQQSGSIFVFPSASSPEKPVSGLRRSWDRVRKEVQHPGLRIHDLRHSYASIAIEGGASLPVIGKALGHAGSRVTELYAHLTEDPVARLSSAVADAMGMSVKREVEGGEAPAAA